jgi:hypothetical protein
MTEPHTFLDRVHARRTSRPDDAGSTVTGQTWGHTPQARTNEPGVRGRSLPQHRPCLRAGRARGRAECTGSAALPLASRRRAGIGSGQASQHGAPGLAWYAPVAYPGGVPARWRSMSMLPSRARPPGLPPSRLPNGSPPAPSPGFAGSGARAPDPPLRDDLHDRLNLITASAARIPRTASRPIDGTQISSRNSGSGRCAATGAGSSRAAGAGRSPARLAADQGAGPRCGRASSSSSPPGRSHIPVR